MKTLQKKISPRTVEQLTFFPEDSPVSHLALQAIEKEQKTLDTSGLKCLEQFEKYPRHGLWGKTFAALLIGQKGWFSTRCRLTWKLRATKSSHFYFQLAALMHGTEEIESGLLLTLTKQMRAEDPIEMRARAQKKNYKNGTVYNSLVSQLIYGLIPTIGKNEGKGASQMRFRGSQEYRGAKTAEFMRTSKEDPLYLHPSFAEAMMGFPEGWTELGPVEMR